MEFGRIWAEEMVAQSGLSPVDGWMALDRENGGLSGHWIGGSRVGRASATAPSEVQRQADLLAVGGVARTTAVGPDPAAGADGGAGAVPGGRGRRLHRVAGSRAGGRGRSTTARGAVDTEDVSHGAGGSVR
jgi:hypothetical protein